MIQKYFHIIGVSDKGAVHRVPFSFCATLADIFAIQELNRIIYADSAEARKRERTGAGISYAPGVTMQRDDCFCCRLHVGVYCRQPAASELIRRYRRCTANED